MSVCVGFAANMTDWKGEEKPESMEFKVDGGGEW
jgi:hypothetical protein